jgi:hypothetical protein
MSPAPKAGDRERLYLAARTDMEYLVLDELSERAGIVWTCRNQHDPWTNEEGEPCEECGKPAPITKEVG